MRLVLSLVFLLCSHRDAAAIQQASEQDQQDITSQLQVVVAAEDGIEKEKVKLNEANGDAALEQEIKTEIARYEKMRINAHERAMWLTLRAYDIIPFVDNDPILPYGDSVLRSPEKGRRIIWVPKFEDIGDKPLQDEYGRPAGTRKFLPRNAGNTASDGVSRMFPSAFESPVQLASYLVHEVRHFWQNTTPGKGDVKTTAELEVEAYEEELKLATENHLGYSREAKKAQLERLALLLNGENGKPGFRAMAKKERAEADKLRGGKPFPERSLISHSQVEIDSLIQQAKDQIKIVQREHDDRLRETVKQLAWRSCSSPGEVTQEELAKLPKPHKGDYWMTGGPEECHGVYAYIAQGGTDADVLKAKSLPPQAVRPNIPARPVVARTPFWPVLPRLQKYAVEACRSSGPVPIDTSLTQPRPPFTFSRDIDDRTATELSAGLGNCERQLFRRLIEVIRSGQGDRITAQWVQETAAGYRTTPGASPGRSAPPQDRVPPDQRHPDIVIPKPPWENRLKGRARP